MEVAQESAVINPSNDLAKWLCARVARLGRNHCVVVGERIERRLYELIETHMEVRNTREGHGLFRLEKPEPRSSALPTCGWRTTSAASGSGLGCRYATRGRIRSSDRRMSENRAITANKARVFARLP